MSQQDPIYRIQYELSPRYATEASVEAGQIVPTGAYVECRFSEMTKYQRRVVLEYPAHRWWGGYEGDATNYPDDYAYKTDLKEPAKATIDTTRWPTRVFDQPIEWDEAIEALDALTPIATEMDRKWHKGDKA